MKNLSYFPGLALLLWLPSYDVAAQPIYIGSPFVIGNVSGGLPFGVGYTVRYQQVYSATDFVPNLPNGGYIDEIYIYGASPYAGTLSSIQINLSTIIRSVDGLSTVFAENVGADATSVFAAATMVVPNGSCCDISFVLSTPFFYNPHDGNLLMDVRSGGASYSATFRSNRDPADTTSRVTTTVGGSVNDPSGFIDTAGLVTRFHAIAVPEPAIWSLWLAGAGLFIVLKRKARRSRACPS